MTQLRPTTCNMQKFIRCRLSTAVPSYAIDLLSKPTKKYPAKAQSKLETVSSLESGIRLATVEDFSSPISSLSLVISAGPRYQSDNKERGFSQWIKNHGFKVGAEEEAAKAALRTKTYLFRAPTTAAPSESPEKPTSREIRSLPRSPESI